MTCPHCLKSVYVKGRTHWNFSSNFDGSVLYTHIGQDVDWHWWIEKIVCPACQRFILTLVRSSGMTEERALNDRYKAPDEDTAARTLIWPRQTGRPPAPPEVPDEFKTDYREACLILADSSRASAALSRGCLQLILKEKMGATGRNLQEQVDWAINSGGLPTYIIALLDVPRQVGNKAAHPKLSKAGEIVAVDRWEAEWCLEVIEALFDFLFVLPAKTQERLARLK